MFYSQSGQDVWVLQQIPRGFFVDVGAHDGVESSNTYALELCGWKGICIEPNKVSYERLVHARKCMAYNVAAVAGDNVSGLSEFSLTSILNTFTAPLMIDYLSIDVDGGEMDVLRGMDFKKYHVRLITIEHNQYIEGPARQEEIYEYLCGKSFYRVHKDVRCLDPNYFGAVYEDWYIHKT